VLLVLQSLLSCYSATLSARGVIGFKAKGGHDPTNAVKAAQLSKRYCGLVSLIGAKLAQPLRRPRRRSATQKPLEARERSSTFRRHSKPRADFNLMSQPDGLQDRGGGNRGRPVALVQRLRANIGEDHSWLLRLLGRALHVALPTNSSSVLQPVGLVMQGTLTHFVTGVA